MLVIGSNELFVSNIKTKRKPYVEHILKQVGDLPYIWIGPPNWKDDTGINELIVENVGKKRYFASKELKYNRCKDGAHPTHKSAAVWADSIASWIMTKSKHPFKFYTPSTERKNTPKATLLQPKK